MQIFGRLLNRAMLSHLVVAVPPAVVLGLMVMSINERALRLEAQQLHLSLATQVRDAIRARAEETATLLGHAERILDLSRLPITQRQDMLRALVADGRLPFIAMYRSDGAFDSLVRPKGAPDVSRDDLPREVREHAVERRWGIWRRPSGPIVTFAWRRDDVVLGYLASRLPQGDLQQLCAELASRFLGDSGAVDVVDQSGRSVLSPTTDRVPDPSTTPLAMVKLSGTGGLMSLEAGIAGEYVDGDGQQRLASLVSEPQLAWLVAASRPARVAFASLDRVRLRVILMSVIAALAAGLVALLMARQISVPVSRLVKAVRHAAKRGFSPEAKVTASGELGQLANTFNYALAQMAEYRRQVQHTTQLRLRLSRFAASNTSARELLARAGSDQPPRPPEAMAVLYADVELDHGDSLSTEHLVTILGEFFSAAHEAIRQEGGRVDRYSGDAVIGIFLAAQLAQPEQAALAAARTINADARAIGQRWSEMSPIRLHASVGVASGSGQLVLDLDDPTGDPTVYGRVVERAASFQRRATADRVIIDAATAAAVQADGLDPASGTGDLGYIWRP